MRGSPRVVLGCERVDPLSIPVQGASAPALARRVDDLRQQYRDGLRQRLEALR
jgi:hypothetical protein